MKWRKIVQLFLNQKLYLKKNIIKVLQIKITNFSFMNNVVYRWGKSTIIREIGMNVNNNVEFFLFLYALVV